MLCLIPIDEVPTRNCQLLEWSQWSKCSKSCGGGLKQRTRIGDLFYCTDEEKQDEQPCNVHICPVSECPKDLLVVRSQDRFSGRYTYVEDKDLWKNLISGELMWKSAEGVYANLLLTIKETPSTSSLTI